MNYKKVQSKNMKNTIPEKTEPANIGKKELAVINKIVKDLLDMLSIDYKAEVHFDKEAMSVLVDIESEKEVGLLIGSRGRTINSLQTLIGAILRNKFDSWVRVVVNVGDWREKENEKIESLALKTAERVRETLEDQQLYNLTPAQRRIVHMVLSNEKDIETESVGEGKERYLVIRLKK
jgi:Predicted RNA-binding protein